MGFWIGVLLVGLAGIGLFVWLRRSSSGSGQAIDLRCTHCGNYFPSREHFAEGQVCRSCHERATARP